MMITPFITKTVRVLQRRKEKLEQELSVANSALTGLDHLTVRVSKPRMAAGTKAKIGKAVRASWRAKRKA